MHRFHLPPEQCRGPILWLKDREAHHATHVLRVRPGETVTVLDGAGNEFLCQAGKAANEGLPLNVSEKRTAPPLPCQLTLLQAIPRGKIIESIIQRSTELGAARIVPLLSERVVTQLDDGNAENKRQKWQQVAVEAIKQCGSPWLPQ